MFGKKKRAKNYQKMVSSRKNKDDIDLYEDYFAADEDDDEMYMDDASDEYYEDEDFEGDSSDEEYDEEEYEEDYDEDFEDEEESESYDDEESVGLAASDSYQYIDEEEFDEEYEYEDELESERSDDDDGDEYDEDEYEGEDGEYDEDEYEGEDDEYDDDDDEYEDEDDEYDDDDDDDGDDEDDFDLDGDDDDDFDLDEDQYEAYYYMMEASGKTEKKIAKSKKELKRELRRRKSLQKENDRLKAKNKAIEKKAKYGRKKDKKGIAAILAFFHNLGGVDWAIAFIGIGILIIAITTSSIYMHTRTLNAQLAEFGTLGTGLDGIDIIGESGLLAVGSAWENRMAPIEEEEPEEIVEEEPEEEEEPDTMAEVVLKVSSIQSDIKIKFINKSTEKLIGGVPFKVHVESDKKSFDWEDDDKDGIIYHTEIPNGTYKVSVESLEGSMATRFELPAKAESIKVTDTIAYKKVDVKEEIKDESQVNAAVEDTAIQDTVVESALADTVEWVESTKTPNGEGESYEEVKDSDIAKPSTASVVTFAKFVGRAIGQPLFAADDGGTLPTLSASLSDVELEVGQTVQFSASVSDGSQVKWSSSSASASVDDSGLVTAISAGSATITVSSVTTGEAKNCTVTVKNKPEEKPQGAATISLDATSASIGVGAKVTLHAKVENDTEKRAVKWKSSDSAIATVNGGEVTGVKAGNATITAYLDGTDISATCIVDVTGEASALSLDATTVSVAVGKTVTVKATASGDVVWTSKDTKIATVDGGVIKGVKEGTTTVEVTLKSDSSVKATVTVNVTKAEEGDTTPLKDTKGNQLYVKLKDATYRAATYADYFSKEFSKYFRKSSATSGYKYTGWQNIDGATYFFDKNGNYVTGEQVIQGARYTFGSDGKLSSGSGTMGIDVSKWNGNIDWNAVKKSGVSFVIIRCGYRGSTTGAMIEDPKFRANIKGAKAVGLNVGVYFFTQAVNEVEAVEEASMALSLIGGYGVNMPVYLDVEASGGRGDGIGKEMRTKVCKAFCQTVQNSGYKAGIYANKTWFTSYINTGSLTSYKIWLAQYASAPTYTATRYDMWQYSSKGSVAGISGNIDMNIRYN